MEHLWADLTVDDLESSMDKMVSKMGVLLAVTRDIEPVVSKVEQRGD
jgi:hypothetical protein